MLQPNRRQLKQFAFWREGKGGAGVLCACVFAVISLYAGHANVIAASTKSTPKAQTAQAQAAFIQFKTVAFLPDRHGFAGMFAGRSHHVVLAAGGANFPQAPPWEQGTKVWSRRIFVYDLQQKRWKVSSKTLPTPSAYGVSGVWRNRLIYAGGSNAEGHLREVLTLEWKDDSVKLSVLPPLPKPCAGACGGVIGDCLVVVGGVSSPSSTTPFANGWVLPLNQQPLRWRVLPNYPGRPRFQAVGGVSGEDFYLFGGIALRAGPDGQPVRVQPYLRDVCSLTISTETVKHFPFADEAQQQKQYALPRKTQSALVNSDWVKHAAAPRGISAAPSPAINLPDGSLWVAGGVDGTLLDVAIARHPGFKRQTFRFQPATNLWQPGPDLPLGTPVVTVPTVVIDSRHWWLISGEVRPGVRTPRILQFSWQQSGSTLNQNASPSD